MVAQAVAGRARQAVDGGARQLVHERLGVATCLRGQAGGEHPGDGVARDLGGGQADVGPQAPATASMTLQPEGCKGKIDFLS